MLPVSCPSRRGVRSSCSARPPPLALGPPFRSGQQFPRGPAFLRRPCLSACSGRLHVAHAVAHGVVQAVPTSWLCFTPTLAHYVPFSPLPRQPLREKQPHKSTSTARPKGLVLYLRSTVLLCFFLCVYVFSNYYFFILTPDQLCVLKNPA